MASGRIVYVLCILPYVVHGSATLRFQLRLEFELKQLHRPSKDTYRGMLKQLS